MLNAQKDLEDIHRFWTLPRERAIELLTQYIEAWNGHEIPDIAESPDSVSLTASVLLWASVRRVNHDLSTIRDLSAWPIDGASERIADIGATVQQLVPLIKKLRGLLPKEASMVGDILQYGGSEARSWMNIAISKADAFAIRGLKLNAAVVNKLFDLSEYDPERVELRLDAEQDRFFELPFHLPDTPGDKSTIGDAVLRLMRGEASQQNSTLSAVEQANQGTTEGTKTATSGDNADISEKKSGRVFCDKCRRLKENWFNRIRSCGDIPLQTFLKEFFANPRKENIWNPIRNGEKKPVTWEAMEKKFRANEVDWKPEYTALLSELRGTIGGH